MLASGAEAAGGRDVASSSGAAGGGLRMAAVSVAAEAGAELGREEDYKGGCNGMVVLPLTTAMLGRWRWRLIVLQWALVATFCNHDGRGSCSC